MKMNGSALFQRQQHLGYCNPEGSIHMLYSWKYITLFQSYTLF